MSATNPLRPLGGRMPKDPVPREQEQESGGRPKMPQSLRLQS